MAPQVFLAHAPEDEELARQVCEGLENVGIACWLPARDAPGPSGSAEYEAADGQALSCAAVVLIIFTSDAAECPRVEHAAFQASVKCRRLVELTVEDAPYGPALARWMKKASKAGQPGRPLAEMLTELVAVVRQVLLEEAEMPEGAMVEGGADADLGGIAGAMSEEAPPSDAGPVTPDTVGPLSEPSIQASSTRQANGRRVQVTIVDATANRQQRATLPADAAVGRIIAKLVQMMGLPTVGHDGQPMNYKFHHRRSGRQLMHEQTLAEAGVADGDVLRLLPEITAGGGPPPLLQRGELHLSAYHPREVVADEVQQLVAYAYLARAEGQVAVHALQTLQLPPEELRGVSATSSVPVPWQSDLIVLPEVKGVQFSPRQQVLSVWEDWQAAVFRFRAAADRVGTGCNGRVGFYVGGLLVADVRVCIFVRDPQTEAVLPETPACAQATPYRRIFPSHSHQDVEIVTACERYAAMCGDQYLRDVRTLRAGEEWSPRLLELIDEAEVFQLFWSANAAGSRYVEEEWRHALGRQLPHFIRPIYWQQPLVAPPVELGHIHFAYVQLRGDGQ